MLGCISLCCIIWLFIFFFCAVSFLHLGVFLCAHRVNCDHWCCHALVQPLQTTVSGPLLPPVQMSFTCVMHSNYKNVHYVLSTLWWRLIITNLLVFYLCSTGQAPESEFSEAVQSGPSDQTSEAGLHHQDPAVDLCPVLQGIYTPALFKPLRSTRFNVRSHVMFCFNTKWICWWTGLENVSSCNDIWKWFGEFCK